MVTSDERNDDYYYDPIIDEQPHSNNLTNKLLIFFAIFLGVVAICIIVFLLWVFFMNRREKTSEQITTVEATIGTNLSEEEPILSEEESIQKMLDEGKELLLAGNYEEALKKYEETKGLDNKCEEVYLFEADIYLKQGNCNAALTVLNEGYAETKSDILVARKEYICKNIVISETKVEGSSLGFVNIYDSFGNLIKEDKVDEKYEFSGHGEIKYNNTGNKVRYDLYDTAGTLLNSYSYGYDASGYLVSQVDYDKDGASVGWHSYSYDSVGHQIECNDYNEKGKNIWNTKTEYDNNGRKIADTGYNAKWKVMGWVETQYDSNGNVCKMTRYDKNGKILEWNDTEYDAKGNALKSNVYTGQNKLSYWTETEYDKEGNIAKTVRYNPDGSVHSYCQYNDIGKIEKERNESLGITYLYAYQYIGDILFECDIEPLSGQLSILQQSGYRRKPNNEAAFVRMAEAGTVYSVIGETEEFYQVEQGWYFSKTQQGIQFSEE